jgi:hypothetical protein
MAVEARLAPSDGWPEIRFVMFDVEPFFSRARNKVSDVFREHR